MSTFKSWAQPIQITRTFSDGSSYVTRATANMLKPYFGLSEGASWSAEGHYKRVVEGIILWVNPLGKILPPVAPWYRKDIREGMHSRLMCVCPECGHELSYGRLHQHMRVHAS